MNNQQFEDQLSAYIMNNTPPLYQSGNGELMSKKKTAFLCSRQVPEMKQYQSIAGQINYHRKETVSFVEIIQNGAGSLSHAIRKENTDHSGIG